VLGSLGEPTFRMRLLRNNVRESKIVADTLEGTSTAFGGAARFASLVDSLQAEMLPTVTLTSGDNSLVGPAFNASLNRATAVSCSTPGYDALVIGNHDFDFGTDIFQQVIEETAPSMAAFLSANLDFAAKTGLQALVTSGRIATPKPVMVSGQEVGITGLITPDLPTISTPRGVTVGDNLEWV
jgi:2',3'-cyclic-nucleotide 2'-phosphodiesterase (5'-nucleotidase family)